jgi:hypothetical protein
LHGTAYMYFEQVPNSYIQDGVDQFTWALKASRKNHGSDAKFFIKPKPVDDDRCSVTFHSEDWDNGWHQPTYYSDPFYLENSPIPTVTDFV